MSRVLVIEDSAAIALLIRRRLEAAGHTVRLAENGSQAVDGLDPTDLPDVVLSDLTMPGLDGIAVARRIKSSHPALPVVLVTAGQPEPELGQEVDAVIPKPIEFDQLLETVERLAPA